MDDLTAFTAARLDEEEAAARAASGGTVVGEPGNWQPAPGGDEWEAHADLTEGDFGPDGDLEVLVALRPGLPRPPEVTGGYWGSVISWRSEGHLHEWVPEPQFRHIARHDPARVLREVAAKRARLAAYLDALKYNSGHDESWETGYEAAMELAVKADASVWSDHPDYRREWA